MEAFCVILILLPSIQGDRGSPLMCKRGGRQFLHGLLSWGELYCRQQQNPTFTDIAQYVDWITEMAESRYYNDRAVYQYFAI